PVVIMDEIIPVDADPADIQKPRNTYDECVEYVINELNDAQQFLPLKVTDNNQLSRPDQLTCMALKSRLLLYAASPLFNGNSEMASLKNKDGVPLINQSQDASKWVKAAEAAKLLIDAMPGGLYKKNDADGNYDALASYRDIYFDRWNKEVIWARHSGGSSGTWEWNGGLIQVAGYANYGATQQLVDAFFMANGESPVLGYNADSKPIINSNSGYVESGPSAAGTKYTKAGVWNMYVNREPRFYASITFSGSEWVYKGADGKTPLYAEFFATGKDGLQGGARGMDPTKSGYVIRKYVSPNSDVFNRKLFDNAAWLFFRLGEIYLNYAEALNESSPGHPDIFKYVNLIRERAGIPQYGSGPGALPVPSSQDEARRKIVAERRVELVFESHRLFDTRRWKIAPQTDGGPM
ncbi:MAG: RagB/SusD family nutrient uptake outer membrane protein, partial [Pedobacter sp.]